MPHIIAIENSEAQRRQLRDALTDLAKQGWPLSGKYDAQTFGTWEKLFETAVTPGLFAQREALVIENAEALGKFPDTLASFLEDDKADCIIILVFGSDTRTLKDITDKITVIKPEPQIPPWKRKDWIITLAKENRFKISQDAAQLLGESIESQEELRNEVLKLALFAQGREISITDVEALSFDEGGKAQLLFLDSVCDNKPADTAKALTYLRTSPLLPVLTAITNRLRPALIMSCFQGKYTDDALKATGTDPAKKNYALNKARSALKHFGADRIKRFMLGAIRLSYLEKTGSAEGWQGFELILWELIAKV